MPGKSGRRDPKSYERTLFQLGQQVSEKAKLAMEAVAEMIVADARTLAPDKAGKLRDNINWKWVHRKDGWAIKINSTPAKNEKGVSYGQYAEWDPLFSKEGRQPFLYPAMDAHREDFYAAVKKAAVEVIRHYGS